MSGRPVRVVIARSIELAELEQLDRGELRTVIEDRFCAELLNDLIERHGVDGAQALLDDIADLVNLPRVDLRASLRSSLC